MREFSRGVVNGDDRATVVHGDEDEIAVIEPEFGMTLNTRKWPRDGFSGRQSAIEHRRV